MRAAVAVAIAAAAAPLSMRRRRCCSLTNAVVALAAATATAIVVELTYELDACGLQISYAHLANESTLSIHKPTNEPLHLRHSDCYCRYWSSSR